MKRCVLLFRVQTVDVRYYCISIIAFLEKRYKNMLLKPICVVVNLQHLEDMYCWTSTCTSRITSSKLHCWTSKIETLKGLMWRLNTITRQQAQKNNSRTTTMRWSITGKPSTCKLIVEYINEARQSLEKNKPYVRRNSILTQWIRPQEGSTQIWTES